ncbi:MAG TPA: glycosyltransferase family A protein [Streptosporangiaceae bacterium]|nr:glycosyltransferase family A protein [Streptosporangiaceae bacterium]
MTQTRPLISVIVPFRDNEDDLADCLDSIAAQTYRELDVIMVDDGSVDGGSAIAEARAARDARFRLLRLTDGGSPGYARNRGLELATGEFLAFADGDDLVPANAYELMVHTLERSGSDLVSGQADRLGPKGVNPSMMHALAIKGRQTGTHISRTPRLLYDATVWNTMFRRSFWDKNKLSFPEGMVFEDIQLMTMAYVLAGKADVIPDVVYVWRERVQGGGSITQRRGDVANLRDRVAALANIDEFLAAQGQRKLRRAHQRKALKNDLWLYVGELHKVTPAYRAEFGALVGDYLAHADRRVLRSLPATHKLAYYLVRRGALDQLAQYAAWLMDQPVRQAPLIRYHGRLVADLPFLRTGLPSGRIPRRMYRPHWRDLDPYMQVDDVQWQGDQLVVAGRANVPSIDVSRRRNTSKVVMLRPPGRRLPRLVRVRSFEHPEATALSEQDRYNYDWSGFRFAVRPEAAAFRQPGTWQAYMLVRGRSVWRPARVHTPVPGRAEHPAPRDVAPGLRFGARWAGLGLNLATWRTTAVLRTVAPIRPALPALPALPAPASTPPSDDARRLHAPTARASVTAPTICARGPGLTTLWSVGEQQNDGARA